MKRITTPLCGFLLLLSFHLHAQNWVGMMRNPNVNVHDVQKAFYQWYEKHHKADIDKDTDIDNDKDHAANGEEDEDEAYGLFKRWEWYNVPRADISGTRANLNKVGSEYANYKAAASSQRLSAHRLTGSLATWTYAGNTAVPTGDGGLGGNGRINRIRTLPGNNNTMFACAASGGLWETTNGGTSWFTTTDQLGDLTTSDVAINPLKTNVMYLATGDGDGLQSIYPTPNSVGVLKSYDGGNTWSATGLTYNISSQYFSVNELLIDPADTSVVLAATSTGIYRSTNSGSSWTQTQTTGWFHSMEFEPGHPSIVYAATSSIYSNPQEFGSGTTGANFYKSTNNGITWANITSGLPSGTVAEGFEIAVSAADSDDVYVLADSIDYYDYYGLYLSTNHGTSFSTQSSSPSSLNILGRASNGTDYEVGQGWYDLTMAVSQTNIDSLWVGGINIWSSANAGASWTLNSEWTGSGAPFVHADIHDIQFLPGTNSQGYVVGCDGGVFTTSNSGTSWTNISSNLEIAQQYSIGPSASTAGLWLTGWQDNGANLSSSPWSLLFGGDGMDCFIDWSNNSNYYITLDNAFYKSTNSGGSFSQIMTNLTDYSIYPGWVPKFLQDPKTSTTLYGGYINVWRSTTSGSSWSAITSWGSSTISALVVDSANTNYIYAAQSNLMEVTTNGSAGTPTWTSITSGLPVGSTSISAIAVSAKSPSHVWVTFSGYVSGDKVYYSNNSGSTWTNVSTGLPNLPVNCIVSESGSPNAVYVGTDDGIYYTDTTMLNSWVSYNTDLPTVMIGDLKIYEPGKELIAATYGRGTWESPLYSSSSCTLSTSASVGTEVTCNGTSTGSVSATPSSGTSPYTYSWSPGSATTQAVSNLSATTYTVTVKDANGCTASASANITQPSALAITMSSHTNVPCNGGTGSATANTPTGGTSPYTYSWSPSGGTNLTANLTAATYTITAEDNHGCTATASVTITQPVSVLGVTMASHTNVLCNGGTGTATANTPTGGTSPYTYTWSPSGGTNLTANLTAATYTITAEDNHGCTATASVIITQPVSALGVTMSTHTNVLCNGGTGSATANTPTGGTVPYTYSWSPTGGTNLTATLTAATYTITAEDNHGCTASASANITQSPALAITMATHTNVLCNGGTGSATANTPTGGTSPYTYTWSLSGGTNLTASNLTAATYTITAEDFNGCTASTSVTITQPVSALAITMASHTNVLCNGGTGSATANTPTGGTTPYTYTWSPSGGTNLTATLTAATYTITAEDNHGCTATASVTITQPVSALGVTMASHTNVLCNGGTGSATANTPTGGTTPYTYSWSPSGGTNLTATLTAATYTITAEDNHGCTASASANITQPSALAITMATHTNVLCNGGTGSATANTATGGTSPYTYTWSPSGGTNLTATLTAATYTITAEDFNGCTASTSVVITQPVAALGITMASHTNVLCNGGTGSATANTPTGGTSPYTYSWSPSGGTNLSANLTAATYTITAEDNHGCTTTASVTITQPVSALGVTMASHTNVLCNGGTGSATANTPTGGTSPYTYTWSPSGGTNLTANLTAATYTITAEDNNGCTATASIAITQPSALGITMSSHTNAFCNGGTGSATANTPTGGTTPYTYTWSPSGGTNLTANLTAATYTVTAEDINGCTATASVTITQPGVLSTTASATNVSCNGDANGNATAAPSGGTSPYTYSWSNGTTTVSTSNPTGALLVAGNYTVTVTDACSDPSATATVNITQPVSALGITMAGHTNALCYGDTASATANAATGGTTPYTYTWSPSGGNNLKASGLNAGIYIIAAEDNHGCTATASATITQPTSMVISQDSVTNTNNITCNGAASVTVVSGGTGPYTYLWTSEVSTSDTIQFIAGTQTTDTIKGQCGGTYCCTITQGNGCSQAICVTVNSNTTGIDNISNSSAINIYPDPNTGQFTIVGLQEGMLIDIYDYTGQKINSSISNNGTMHFDISTQANGIYLIRIQNRDGSLVTQSKIIKIE